MTTQTQHVTHVYRFTDSRGTEHIFTPSQFCIDSEHVVLHSGQSTLSRNAHQVELADAMRKATLL